MTTHKMMDILTGIAFHLNCHPQNHSGSIGKYDFRFQDYGYADWRTCLDCYDKFLGWGLYVIKKTNEEGGFYCQRCLMGYQGEIMRVEALLNLNKFP